MTDLRKENVVEDMEEKHYLVMPFNNKWYKLKMEFTCFISLSSPATL